MNTGRRILALALATLLPACGFHLRGDLGLPAQRMPVYVKAPATSRVGPALVRRLAAAGVPVSTDPGAAGMVIQVFDEQQDSRVVAVNQAGKVVASELRLRVDYRVEARAGGELVPRQTLRLAREQINPEIEVLGKAEEAALMRKDLVADMADRILQQVRVRLR